MTLTSDITLDASKFKPENHSEESIKINAWLEDATRTAPRWENFGIIKYRERGEKGEGALPIKRLPDAKDETIPSREEGRSIPVRVYTPDNGEPSKGVFLHIHGGGYVLGSHTHQDIALQRYANKAQLTSISIGYRLAPENPWPAGIHDCIDAAEHLIAHGLPSYSVPPNPLLLIGGESAGGNLSALTAFHLIKSHSQNIKLAGLVFIFGHFDLTNALPSASTFTRPLLINNRSIQVFIDAYTPGMSVSERRNPDISPLYADMHALAKQSAGGKLPPAVFVCGTEDPVLDDTLMMSVRWMATGSDALVKIYPGAPHGFTAFPGYGPGQEAIEVVLEFVKGTVEGAGGL